MKPGPIYVVFAALALGLIFSFAFARIYQHEAQSCQKLLTEKTVEFNGCLDSFNFCEVKLVEHGDALPALRARGDFAGGVEARPRR